MMKKAKSSYELAPPKLDLRFRNPPPLKFPSSADLHHRQQQQQQQQQGPNGNHINNHKSDGGKHKVVIYFSDAYNNICNKQNGSNDIDHATRLANEMQLKPSISLENVRGGGESSSSNSQARDFMAQLKTVLEEKSKFTNKFDDCNGGVGNGSGNGATQRAPQNKFLCKPPVPEKPNVLVQINHQAPAIVAATATTTTTTTTASSTKQQINGKTFGSSNKLLPSFIESIDENNVIKLKIEQNFKKASDLVNLIASLPKHKQQHKQKRQSNASHETSSIHELNFSHDDEDSDVVAAVDCDDDDDAISEPDEGYFYDWSFVQEWRSR